MTPDILTSSFLALREKLFRTALKFLRNDEDASDALQDTFFRLWKKGPVESDDEAKHKLFAVLHNVCIDRLRKHRTIAVDEIETQSFDVIDVEGKMDIEKLETLLTTGLSDTQKIIYKLIIQDGIEYEATAAKLGMTVEAVRTQMCRTRKKIRENYLILNR